MIRHVLFAAFLSLALASTAIADTASGLPSGKRQHKPVSTTQPVDKEEKGKEVAPAQQPTPAMNKADLTESLANKTGVEKKKEAEQRTPETLRHKDRAAADEKTDKNEAARAKRKKKKD